MYKTSYGNQNPSILTEGITLYPPSFKRDLFSVRVAAMQARNTVIVAALSNTGAPPVPHLTCSLIALRIQGCLVFWWFACEFVAPPAHLLY